MLVLDTDHLSEMDRRSPQGMLLRERLAEHADEVFVTIVSAEELLKGWLAAVHGQQSRPALIYAYARFDAALESFDEWMRLPWDEDASGIFAELRGSGVRVGTMDLRIASIAKSYEATLLSRNLKHFRQVPGLKVENWLE